MNNFLDSALHYASIGWHIFPIAPGQKIPLTSHGVKDATTDENQIHEWWSKWPNANIAVACGSQSGIYVVDVDVSSDGSVNGLESLKEFPELPATVRQQTPRGGFHAFYKTDNAPVNRNSFRPGIDIRGNGYYVVLAPSIHPNGGRYNWCDNCAPGQIGLAEYPDYMRPTVRAPWAAPVLANANLGTAQHGSDILQRASLYLAECEPAIQGQGGHDKLLWACTALVHGFQLSDCQAFDLLVREYNPRCVPPWDFGIPADEKDFRRKITEARRLTPQQSPGWLLNDPSFAPIDTSIVDLEKIIANRFPAPIESQEILLPPVVSGELQFLTQPTGLLGEICSWINATALKEQPFLSLACSLAFLGAVFGRKVKDAMGSRTNIYCMGITPSSGGKTHAMNQIRRLCESAGCTDLLGGDDIASDSAIEERISRVESTLFLWDEIGYLLSHIKSGVDKHCAKVVSLLMKLYSAAGSIYKGREYAEAEKQRTIIQPCCCIYGTSTLERFTGGISPAELQDGWLSRCLVFCSLESPRKKRGRLESPVPQNIADKVRNWYLRRNELENDGHSIDRFVTSNYTRPAPQQIVVPTGQEAEKVFIEFDDLTTKFGKDNPQLACLWAKGEENARRIALIIAAGESFENPIITKSIADYSCRLVSYLLCDFGRIVIPEIVSSTTENNKRKLINVIKLAGVQGAQKREITFASRWADKRTRDNLLADLIESGEIACSATKDNKTVRYWTAENYQKYLLSGE